eukprot:SAG31_NODE_125_length_23649_cov_7.156202_5_plen_558_part_00
MSAFLGAGTTGSRTAADWCESVPWLGSAALREIVRVVTFSFLCPLLEKYGTFIARCNALIEKVSSFRASPSRPVGEAQLDDSEVGKDAAIRRRRQTAAEIAISQHRQLSSIIGAKVAADKRAAGQRRPLLPVAAWLQHEYFAGFKELPGVLLHRRRDNEETSVLERLFRECMLNGAPDIPETASRALAAELVVVAFAAVDALPPTAHGRDSVCGLGQLAPGRCKCRACTKRRQQGVLPLLDAAAALAAAATVFVERMCNGVDEQHIRSLLRWRAQNATEALTLDALTAEQVQEQNDQAQAAHVDQQKSTSGPDAQFCAPTFTDLANLIAIDQLIHRGWCDVSTVFARLHKIGTAPPGKQLRATLKTIASQRKQLAKQLRDLREQPRLSDSVKATDLRREDAALRALAEATERKLEREKGQEVRLEALKVKPVPVIASDEAVALLACSVFPVLCVRGIQAVEDHDSAPITTFSALDRSTANRLHDTFVAAVQQLQGVYCAGLAADPTEMRPDSASKCSEPCKNDAPSARCSDEASHEEGVVLFWPQVADASQTAVAIQ